MLSEKQSRDSLYIFEGPDCTGKSTLVQKVHNKLKANGIQVEYISFPGNEKNTLGKHIYELHHKPRRFGIKILDPTSLQVLHIAAHIDIIESKIAPAIKEGKIILLDRYWWSTFVYGLVKGAKLESLKAMIQLEMIHWNQLKPTIAFLITSSKPYAEVNNHQWKRLRSEYQKIVEVEKDKYQIIEINNDRSVSETVNQILKYIHN